ncbi:MAG: hypothetical protein M3228_09200 [Actinomycetota bacterium]|nr:hypothetical protein [Actinomycetota bacterium]
MGYATTVELVRAVARVPRGEARARVSVAADVLPGRGLGGVPVERSSSTWIRTGAHPPTPPRLAGG